MPVLRGETVFLREWRAEDFSALESWLNDEGTTRFLGSAFWPALSLQEAENYLRARMESSYNAYHFVIASLRDEKYLGQVDLLSLDWRMRCAQVAIVIGREENRGRGIGREALSLLKYFAFNTLGLERLELEVLDQNERAIAAYRHAGFREEGRRRHAFFCEGRYHDQVLMGCLRGE